MGGEPGGFIHSVIFLRSACKRSPKTTNLDRILRDLLDDVLQGYRTVQEADTTFGRHGGKTAPANRSFADYLDDRIRYATDPAVEHQLRDVLARTAQAGRVSPIDTRRINRLLADTGRAHADRLRELRAELAGSGEAR